MPFVTLTCPSCGFSKELEQSILPAPGTTITCPRCCGTFPLTDDVLRRAGEPPPPAVAPPAPVAQPRPQRRTLTFTFTGSGKEYFGIWIVNTLLRIITLGIYSPWAKVRKRRYFYTNTLLDDAPFDYLADPLAILKGWFIAGAFIGLYSLASKTNPILAFLLGLVIFGAFPWVVVRSRLFNLRNSTHRNIRFNFAQNYKEAYEVFLVLQLAVPFTLGILAPYVFFRQKRFLVESSSYGTTPFRFHATARDYYRVFLPIILAILLCVLLFAGSIFLANKGMSGGWALSAVPAISFFAIYFFAAVYIPTVMANLTWSSTSIGKHRFESTLRVRDLAWIYVSNVVAVICTVGLLTPWATVRLVRYRLDRLTLTGTGDLAVSAADADSAVRATGEELGDMLGFDLGL